MKKIKAAIVGYGNIGKYTLDAIQEAPDFELAGVVRRSSSLSETPMELSQTKVTSNLKELGKIDVVIICAPSRTIPDLAQNILSMGINTVDSYDIHTDIWELKKDLKTTAIKNNTVAVISAGWDPGSDSMVRALFQAIAPKGITYTNFGPGMSMGHSTAVKSISGVKEALSLTIPLGTGIHRRMVYIELEKGFSFDEVEQVIKTDEYFIHDETHVVRVDDIQQLKDMGHGVKMERKGVSGKSQNQLFELNMKIDNPALTAQILVCAARASLKQKPGCYTLIEMPVIDLLFGEEEQLIKDLV
ncbi:MAG: diaminopimelate dehydrogenase [Candidatus Caldatribacteriota bacterium]|nr:diaminopimelate dehydrogenase [Candidatus Caldatribacteriota bacterium]